MILLLTLQKGRLGEAEAVFERLLGVSHVKSAIAELAHSDRAELARSDRGDDTESVRFSDLFYGRHFKGI